MEELMLALIGWINLNTEYDTRVELPNIVITEPANLCRQYGIDKKGTCKATHLKGFYNRGNTIYLHKNFDPEKKHDQSQLLHELVHYVQWHNELSNECWGTLESEAYTLHDDWREEHNLARHADPFKLIMLEAACEA